MEIKQACLEDVPQIYRIEQQVFADAWSIQNLEESLQQDVYFAYVVTIQAEIVAYYIASCVLDEAELLRIAVQPDHQGQKIGQQLMRQLMQIICEKKITACFLEVRKSNMAAINLYEQMKFITEGKRKNYYKNPTEDAVIMSWHSKL